MSKNEKIDVGGYAKPKKWIWFFIFLFFGIPPFKVLSLRGQG